MEYRRKHAAKKKKTSAFKVILRDFILLGVALNVFALFHHVIPRKLQPVDASLYAAVATTPTPNADTSVSTGVAADVTATPEPTATPVAGDFSASFPSTDTGTNSPYSYQTDTVRIAIDRIQENDVTYFVADVYVKNIDALKTAFAKGTYGKSIYAFPTETAVANNTMFAVTGDYYSARSSGVVIRNGTLYRDVAGSDVCVLYNDGEMKTYLTEDFNLTDAVARGVWQAWSFGPPLLGDNGAKLTEFDSSLTDRHPRSAIGYYAPGHYCFVVVDGRQSGYSVGMRLTELSALFESLGCKQAYNLDGGATAIMMFQGNVINQPYKGGRESGDIIYFN
jgi:exopolysaccharide biosynthesis protein